MMNMNSSFSLICSLVRICIGREGKGVCFTTILVAWLGFNSHPGHVVASLNKMVYDDVELGGFELAANFVDNNWKKFTRSLETPKRIPLSTKYPLQWEVRGLSNI